MVPGVTTDRCRGRCHRRDEERTTAKFFFTLTAAGRPVMANVFFLCESIGNFQGFCGRHFILVAVDRVLAGGGHHRPGMRMGT